MLFHQTDVYLGRIAVNLRGQWYWGFLAPGYCTIAESLEPNRHLGICRITDLVKGKGDFYDADDHRFIMIGPMLSREEVRDVDRVRFGRTACLAQNGGLTIVDACNDAQLDHDDLLLPR